jgi:hypothetical protein
MLLLERHSSREETLLLDSELATPVPREPYAPGEPPAAPAAGLFEILGDTPLLFFRSRGELYLRADPVLLRVTPEVASTRINFGDLTHLSFHIAGRFTLRIPYPTPDGDYPAGTLLEDIDFGFFVENVLGTPERRAAIWRDLPGDEVPSPGERIVPPLLLRSGRSYKKILFLDSEIAAPVFAERTAAEDPQLRRPAGLFDVLGGLPVLLFRSRGSLYVRADPVLVRITPEVQSAQWSWDDASRLAISLADRFLLEVPYETPDFVGSPVGVLPYCDKEDVDFGMRVDEILKHPMKREKVWSPAWWGRDE